MSKRKLCIKLQNRVVGEGAPAFVVAEVSANHGQDLVRAIAMIKRAKECGADAVKFQAYTPDTMTIKCDNKYFRIKHPKWGGQTLYQLYEKAYTPWKWFKKLKKAADDAGIIFFATAFDRRSVDFLEELNVPFHKIASFEIVDLPLIEYAAKTWKPVILSTGMASLPEIKDAVKTAKDSGARDIALLKCVSSYPAVPKEMNLRTIADMRDVFKMPIGISDHTLDIGVSVAAVCFGASIIEKHFTLERKFKTPDSFFSTEPHELKELIKNIRVVESSLGNISYGLTSGEKKSLIFRRSIFAVKDIKKGDLFTLDNVRSIRPSVGIKPVYLKTMIDKKARRSIRMGEPIRLRDI